MYFQLNLYPLKRALHLTLLVSLVQQGINSITYLRLSIYTWNQAYLKHIALARCFTYAYQSICKIEYVPTFWKSLFFLNCMSFKNYSVPPGFLINCIRTNFRFFFLCDPWSVNFVWRTSQGASDKKYKIIFVVNYCFCA